MKPSTKQQWAEVLCAIEWLQANWQDLGAMARHVFVCSEPHLSGHQVRIGFETSEAAMKAHTLLAKLATSFEPPPVESACACSEDSWGHIKCEERSGPPGTFCKWERRQEQYEEPQD